MNQVLLIIVIILVSETAVNILSYRLLYNKRSKIIMMMNESIDIFDLVHEYLSTKGLLLLIYILMILFLIIMII